MNTPASRDVCKPIPIAKRPSLASLLLASVPIVAICLDVSLWDRVYPIVLGLPFNFFWLMLWLLLTPLSMWGVYRIEGSHRPANPPYRNRNGAV